MSGNPKLLYKYLLYLKNLLQPCSGATGVKADHLCFDGFGQFRRRTHDKTWEQDIWSLQVEGYWLGILSGFCPNNQSLAWGSCVSKHSDIQSMCSTPFPAQDLTVDGWKMGSNGCFARKGYEHHRESQQAIQRWWWNVVWREETCSSSPFPLNDLTPNQVWCLPSLKPYWGYDFILPTLCTRAVNQSPADPSNGNIKLPSELIDLFYQVSPIETKKTLMQELVIWAIITRACRPADQGWSFTACHGRANGNIGKTVPLFVFRINS